MLMEPNCILLGKTSINDSFTVRVCDKNNINGIEVLFDQLKISGLKYLIYDEIKKYINNDDYNDLNLWKADIAFGDKLKDLTEEQICKDSEQLVPITHFKKYFPDQDAVDKSLIFVQVPATELERKRKNTEVETTSEKKRRWAVNSALMRDDRHLFYYSEPEGNDELSSMIWKGEYVALYGARASGKSTRVQRIRELLKDEGLNCIYVTFEHIMMETSELFWTTLGSALVRDVKPNIDTDNFKFSSVLNINSARDFIGAFGKDNCRNLNVVLFIDEFDKLYEADQAVVTSCLETFRGIKNSKYNYAIQSIVAIGTFSILHLKSERTSTSPFNVNEPYQNPNFTFDQVKTLYKAFGDEYNFTIDPEIIKDIYTRTSGHAGLVCLCGRSIFDNLIKKIGKDNKLSFINWTKFVTNSIEDAILDYATFRNMINFLKTNNKAKSAVDLLRSVFLGFFDFVQINDEEELELAEFLVAEGVLMRDEKVKKNFKMSSVLVNELIRKRVIPVLYKSSPALPVPQTDEGSLKVLDALIEAVRYFDKTIIRNAFNRSFKTALVKVDDGCHNVKVPRESVYDTELNRILVNWIVKECNFEVTGQWHLIYHADNDEKDKHYYSNIIIISLYQTVVLELLATATENELNEHFERVLNYAKMLSANDIWIVNFTCEDDATKKPYWPPNDGKFESVNVVHFFHDRKFENVRMSARYMSSGTFSYITDQVIQLLD
ncbi:hypothetical protein RhiirA1_502660 [Rhizophagus irregularis]|uniref:Uncharacterized protein n=1 Tax=Rhizophagus irregularis TaxID=588596 RepID=A0A2I1FDP9_9GLOM|nr:hypothetical protein RhiirA1_502660 [Rhizophagus irregularis]PKY32504.1 hypothetical protein RhiirB3_492136 [Rhizophagus irregularis]